MSTSVWLGYLLIMAFLSSFGPRKCKSCNSHATVDLFDTFSVKYIKSLFVSVSAFVFIWFQDNNRIKGKKKILRSVVIISTDSW